MQTPLRREILFCGESVCVIVERKSLGLAYHAGGHSLSWLREGNTELLTTWRTARFAEKITREPQEVPLSLFAAAYSFMKGENIEGKHFVRALFGGAEPSSAHVERLLDSREWAFGLAPETRELLGALGVLGRLSVQVSDLFEVNNLLTQQRAVDDTPIADPHYETLLVP